MFPPVRTGSSIPASTTRRSALPLRPRPRGSQHERRDRGPPWFLALANPAVDLVIVGAVHVAQALTKMAALVGFRVRVIDPRTSFATNERFPGVALSHEYPDEALAHAPLGRRSAIVTLSTTEDRRPGAGSRT